MAKPKTLKEEKSFEQLYAELEATVAKMEAGDLPLDDALALFQRGMELAQQCGVLIDQAELRIKELVPQGTDLTTQDFEED